MKIKYIVETFIKARDRSGNCYHKAYITSTETGKRLRVDLGLASATHAYSQVKKITGLEYEAIYSCDSVVNATEFAHIKTDTYDHLITDEQIRNLAI